MIVSLWKNKALLNRGKRLSGHFFWYATGFGLHLALPQLVLFPLCLHFMGAEAFGKFIYVVGIVSMVGLAPTNGLTATFLRNVAGVAEERHGLFLRTTFMLAACLVGSILFLAILACLFINFFSQRGGDIVLWIAIIALAFAAQNMIGVGIVDLRFKRRFRTAAFWQSIGSALAFLALPALFLIGNRGVPIGFSTGHILAFVLLLAVRGNNFVSRPYFDKAMAKRIGATWFVLSVSVLFLLSSHYIHRTMLGLYASYEMVSVFFAASVTLTICIMPISLLGLFGIPILSTHNSIERFSPRFCRLYSVAAVVGGALFYVLVILVARWPLYLLYPAVAHSAAELIPLMGIGISMVVLIQAVRPFVIKFASSRTFLLIGIVSLISHCGSAMVLIPKWGLRGAAWAYCIGNSIVALNWFGVFVTKFAWRINTDNKGTSVDSIDPGSKDTYDR